ncbi:hypothetical protein [Lacticaseibacillus suihuaensis]
MTDFIKRFNQEDSFAIWPTPPAGTDLTTQVARNAAFKAAYQPGYPAAELAALDALSDEAWAAKMAAVRYVLVGLNPGNAGTAGHFSNFHGAAKSNDANLAAVVSGTPVWGAFMTDLSQTVESDSSKVRVTPADVAALYQHLDALGIPQDAVVIALHSAVAKALGKASAQALRPFDAATQVIPHYSYLYHNPITSSQKARRTIEALSGMAD